MVQHVHSTPAQRGVGRPTSPRGTLHPQFITIIRSQPGSLRDLARLAGWPSPDQLGRLLTFADEVIVTTLTVHRLARVAEAIGYDGPLFTEAV